jgi:hypothetical protein
LKKLMREIGGEEQLILRSEYLARRLPHKRLAPGVGGALEGVLMMSDQSGHMGGDVTVGSAPLYVREY